MAGMNHRKCCCIDCPCVGGSPLWIHVPADLILPDGHGNSYGTYAQVLKTNFWSSGANFGWSTPGVPISLYAIGGSSSIASPRIEIRNHWDGTTGITDAVNMYVYLPSTYYAFNSTMNWPNQSCIGGGGLYPLPDASGSICVRRDACNTGVTVYYASGYISTTLTRDVSNYCRYTGGGHTLQWSATTGKWSIDTYWEKPLPDPYTHPLDLLTVPNYPTGTYSRSGYADITVS